VFSNGEGGKAVVEINFHVLKGKKRGGGGGREKAKIDEYVVRRRDRTPWTLGGREKKEKKRKRKLKVPPSS